ELARLRLELVGAPEPLERALDLAERGVELAGAPAELGARGVVARERGELAGVDLREAPLRARHLGEALELLPYALVGEILVEELRHGLEGRAVVLELLLVEGREAREQVAPLARLLARSEARFERDLDPAPVGAAQVHRLEHLAGAGLVLRLLGGLEEA